MFIDIHTHKKAATHKAAIQNLQSNFEEANNSGHFSIGLRPWYITTATFAQQFKLLEKFATQPTVLAIGECGLDKICTTDFSLQKQAFSAQIILANQVNKPLIIHCVKAHAEVLNLLKQHRNQVPVVFHGFNNSERIAKQIIDMGFYLSFGKALMKKNIQHLLVQLPINKLVFETDDAAIAIENVYQLAATSLKIDVEAISLQIEKNVATIFGAENFNA